LPHGAKIEAISIVIFGGGVAVILDGTIVGAVGASAGTVEQDIAVAEAAITALGHQGQSSDNLNLKPITLKGKQI
jgi:uncharacterized protein GlcG (DUF336 family)